MSREIKFRAWDKETGKMHYQINKPRTNENIADELIIQFACTGYSARTDNKYIGDKCLMQYTGIKDKNGKKIYEGDVVRLNSINYEIIYRRYHACFMLQHKDYSGEVFFHFFHEKGVGNWENTEIIGNIYENPELITEVKNG